VTTSGRVEDGAMMVVVVGGKGSVLWRKTLFPTRNDRCTQARGFSSQPTIALYVSLVSPQQHTFSRD